MLSTGERPRELRWFHAGPMLFGDWGTSRLYVLGLAYFFTGHASFWFIGAMCVLMIGVGWSYEIVCRLFPDGGGVYSSAQMRSQLLAVVGGLLLCADYVVTASMSCLDAFHYLGDYLGLSGVNWLGLPVEAILTAVTILAVGALNYFGPSKTGTLAMIVALATVALTLVIAVFALPHLGIHSVKVESPFTHGYWNSWVGFTEIVLALSGVEAIANMTGIMIQPVQRTARLAILPVLAEIVILNLILAAAMNALPDTILNERLPDGSLAHTADMLKVIAKYYVGPMFSNFSAVIFSLLLLSAVNTAVGALVSILFMLSRDKELPHAFSGLNRFGMPVLALVVASVVPAVIVLIFPNVEALAGLYAIGVVGAISINLGSVSTNPKLSLKGWERAFMGTLTAIMVAIGATICIVKPHARSFALLVLVIGLAGRLATVVANRSTPISRSTRVGYLTAAVLAVLGEFGVDFLPQSQGWEQALNFGLSTGIAVGIGYASSRTQKFRDAMAHADHAGSTEPAPARKLMMQPGSYPAKERVMVATQGNPRLLAFAMKECKSRLAELQILFIRHLAVTPMGPTTFPSLAEDEPAQELFERMRVQAKEQGVPLRLLYGVARDIPDAILDMTVTHGADMLVMGATRRGTLWKAMKGDVISAVAEQLPESVTLLIHA